MHKFKGINRPNHSDKPNPADSFVPEIPIIPEAIPDIAAVKKIGIIMTGYLTIFGIIIFTPPKNIDKGIPT